MNITNYITLIILFFIIGWFSTGGKKSQFVRLLDIFFYGPVLILLSTKIENIYYKIILLFMGTTTVSYNLKNYIDYKEDKE